MAATGGVRLAQQQGGLFEAVFDEIVVRRRLERGAERAQAGGLGAVRAHGERVERDVLGVMRGDVLEDVPRAHRIRVVALCSGGERCVRAQQQHEFEKMHEDRRRKSGRSLLREAGGRL